MRRDCRIVFESSAVDPRRGFVESGEVMPAIVASQAVKSNVKT